MAAAATTVAAGAMGDARGRGGLDGAGLQAGIAVYGGISEELFAAKVTYPNPVAIFPRHGWFNAFISVVLVLVAISGVVSVAAVFTRRRGASAELRKHLAWLGYADLMTGFWALALLVAGLAGANLNGPLGTLLWMCLVLTLVAGIPLACAVAVLDLGNLVRAGGFEPPRCCHQQDLNLPRMPFRHARSVT
jgi:hypothetical protein